MTQKTIRKPLQPSAAAEASPRARPPGAIPHILDDLELAEGLISTTHDALGADDVDTDSAQRTLGLALKRLRAGLERVRALKD
jgi:hypothetical protein